MPVPTWRLAVVAAIGALIVLAAPAPLPALVAVNVAVLAAVAVDWARATPRRVEVTRTVPNVARLDEECELVWRVRNAADRAVRVHVADELVGSLGAASRGATLTVPARGRAIARTTLRPSRRGRFDITELAVRTEGPWGLVARQDRRQLPARLRVHPPFHSRREAELRIEQSRILEVGLRSAQGRGGGTEFDALREYTVDDEFRRIDWAATARRGKPIVRTYRAERNQTVIVLLDTGRVMAGRVRTPSGEVPRLDHGMDAAMALTTVATRLGDRAGFAAFADRVRAVVPPAGARGQLGRVTDAMYALEPELVESDYRAVFADTLARFRRRALLVVLTELAEQAVAENLEPALPLVVRDHVVVVAAVRDPNVDWWASAVPTEAGAAYRKAAAVRSLAVRRRTIARLRGLGAVVVDAPPGRLAPELADVYLNVKATGRL